MIEKLLPVPKNAKFRVPDVPEDQFNDPDAPDTDETLLKTGEWDDYDEDAGADEGDKSGKEAADTGGLVRGAAR